MKFFLAFKAPSHFAEVRVDDPRGTPKEIKCLTMAAEQVKHLGLPAGVSAQSVEVLLRFTAR